MKSFKLFLTSFASICLVVQTAFASAQYDNVKLKRANEVATVDLMEDQLKMIFTTDEDHRKISYEFVKLKKITEKWDWRYEVQGDSIGFRVNGKVQAYVKPVSGSFRKFTVNGTPIEFKKGLSFQAYLNQVETATKNNAFNLEELFIQKAEAAIIFPLLIGGAIGLAAGLSWCRSASAEPAPTPSDDRLPTPEVVEEINSCPTGRCGRRQPEPARTRSCTQSGRRYTRVSPFTSQQMWRSAQNFKSDCTRTHTRADGRTEIRLRGGCFRNADDCTRWKTHQPSHAFGNNLSESRARQICNSLEREVRECQGGRTPTPQPQPQPQPQPEDPGDWNYIPEGSGTKR